MRISGVSVVLLCAAAAPAQFNILERGPIVWSPTESSLTIGFRSVFDARGSVDWGTTPSLGRSTSRGAKDKNHEITIEGLQPERFYYYRVRLDGRTYGPVGRARTYARTRDATLTFFVMGDTGSGLPTQWAVRDELEKHTFDLGILPGDIVYPSGERQLFNPVFFWPYAKLLRHTPFYPALGNHDVKTDNAAAYLRYFAVPRSSSGSKRYYSFDVEGVHFVCLDSNDMTPAQTAWLRADLADSRRRAVRWLFVYLHHPPYSSGDHGRFDPVYRTWSPLFEEFEVDAVFAGHDHMYERTKVARDHFPKKRGVVYFVVGSGGAVQTAIRQRQPYSAYALSGNGFLKVDVRGSAMHTTFYETPVTGGVRTHDSYAIRRGPTTEALRATTANPTVGGVWRGMLEGAQGAPYTVMLSPGFSYVPTPFGIVHVDLAAMVPLRFGTIAADGVPLALRVPNTASIRGADLMMQAVLLRPGDVRLTDVLRAVVR